VIHTLGQRRLETADDDWYIAPGAQVIGSVRLGSGASVWFNSVLRGDSDWIVIGDGTNIQDGTVIHTDEGEPTHIGRNVTVGHVAFLHGCTIGDGSLIANGARVLDGARIGERCVVAAGALVPPRKTIPDGSLVMGAPAQIVRQVTAEDIAMIEHACAHYRERARLYRAALARDPRTCS
jgi:carbonic anhydrase/acetyltransferase-like protein (isoleucine patch superfamily)